MSANIMRIGGAVTIGAAMLASAPAAAAVITQNYVVSANFIQQSAPVKSLTVGFTLTYDPLLSYTNKAVSNYTSSSAAPQFNNMPVVFSSDFYTGFGSVITVSGGPNGSAFQQGTNDFFITLFVDTQGAPIPTQYTNVEYTFVGFNAVYNTRLASVVLRAPTTSGGSNPPPGSGGGAVPEPATWAMMLVGFGAIGAATRHRRRRVVFS